jgi:hypothetical protein
VRGGECRKESFVGSPRKNDYLILNPSAEFGVREFKHANSDATGSPPGLLRAGVHWLVILVLKVIEGADLVELKICIRICLCLIRAGTAWKEVGTSTAQQDISYVLAWSVVTFDTHLSRLGRVT